MFSFLFHQLTRKKALRKSKRAREELANRVTRGSLKGLLIVILTADAVHVFLNKSLPEILASRFLYLFSFEVSP